MLFFGEKKKKRELHALMARILNLSGTYMTDESEQRGENRRFRSFPVVIVPYEKRNGASISEAVVGVTKDVSGGGTSVLVQQKHRPSEHVLVGFLFEGQPRMILGDVRHRLVLGGGFWQVGIEFTEVLDADPTMDWQDLQAMIHALDPHAAEPAPA